MRLCSAALQRDSSEQLLSRASILYSGLSFIGLSVICLGRRSNTWEVAGSIIMRRWKWLFENGCDFRSPIYTSTEFLKTFCRDGGKYIDVLVDYADMMTLN